MAERADAEARGVKATGYMGFGSFHSRPVEEMLEDASFEPPAWPFAQPPLPGPDVAVEQVGADCFYLDKSWTFLNHGAFGAVSEPAMESARRWRLHAERQPLQFFDRLLFPHLVRPADARRPAAAPSRETRRWRW